MTATLIALRDDALLFAESGEPGARGLVYGDGQWGLPAASVDAILTRGGWRRATPTDATEEAMSLATEATSLFEQSTAPAPEPDPSPEDPQ